ncbi:MAG: type 4a pilus biogenesis protein PilO [Acidimicrobiales bacterium]
MKRLGRINFDLLKRPRVLISIGVVIVLVIAFYFAWWSPESTKLTSVDAQKVAKQLQITQLNARIATLKTENRIVAQDKKYLGFFDAEIPPLPEQGNLVYLLGQLEKADNVFVSTIGVSTVDPPSTGSSIGTIPISLSLTGSHSGCIKFLEALYKMPRLITVQSINPAATSTSAGGVPNVLLVNGAPFSLTLSATAYFSQAVVAAS